jgi:hypothetical protein
VIMIDFVTSSSTKCPNMRYPKLAMVKSTAHVNPKIVVQDLLYLCGCFMSL